MVYVHGKARIRHAETGEVYEITPEMIDFQSVGSEERSMGVETAYSAVVDHPQLGQLVWSIWEYPEGVENDRQTDVGQHELLEDIDLNLGHEPFSEDDDDGYTGEDRQARIAALVEWFHQHYEDPAHRLPYESAEGGYQWINGGPYDAREILDDNFPNDSEDIVNAAVEEIESEGLFDWSPVPSSDDYDRYDDEDLPEDSDPNKLAGELAGLIADLPTPTNDPVFEWGDEGLLHMVRPPDAAAPAALDGLLDELRFATKDLLQSLAGTNGHPNLLHAAERYSEAICGETVSISQVYSRGVCLANAASAAESAIANDDQPPLPAGVEEHLSSVVDLNRAYIMSQPEGRAIAEGADAYRRTPAETEEMRRAAQRLANAINSAPNLFGNEVRTHVAEIVADVGQGPQPERSNQTAATTLGNLTTTLLTGVVGGIVGAIAIGSAPGITLVDGGIAFVNLAWTFLTTHASTFSELAGAFGADLSWMTSIARLLDRIKKVMR